MNTSELGPGRELDAFIAEKVMGCKLWRQSEALRNVKDQSEYEEFRRRDEYICECAGRIHMDRDDYDGITGLKRYSTDISSAWPIVEMFRSRGEYKIEISAYPKDELWTIKAYHRDGYSKSCTTSEKTLPHAICLAALKAIETQAGPP